MYAEMFSGLHEDPSDYLELFFMKNMKKLY